MRNTILIICFFLALQSFSNYKANTTPHLFKTTLNLDKQNKPIALYKNGFLYIKDINSSGKIEVYTIIGNKILTTNIQNFQDSKIPILLENQNMYIIRIETQNQVYTIKIVA
ncbi:MAG: hypothetical protein CMC91_02710 [Flavobacteriaceae bacterium]|nr:hypothetical protein [Flavobacteriaceae bacterium]|tara:strand:+ start:3851 stop:4186 length:336 start_codon:yes stop_codon:yes gene_type:complete